MEQKKRNPDGNNKNTPDALDTEASKGQNQCLEKKAGYFKWMLDEYIGYAYVADIESYELLYLNQTCCKTVGLPKEKLVGHKCYEIIQGRNAPCPFCTNECLGEEEFYEWEYYNPFFDSTYMIKNRIIDWDGHKARLELSQDSHSLEYRLKKKEREQEAIIRTIPGGFARVDARDMKTILWYGGGFLQMIGYTEEQFEQELKRQCSYVHPEDVARSIQIMQDSRDKGEDTVVEARIFTRSGEKKILTMTFSYVSSDESWDGLESFYSVGIDITRERAEQARQRKALEDAYQAAKVANQAKTNFLSAMSHDIRTPMNAIIGMTAIARENLDSPEKVYNCLNKIDISSRHLLNLLNEVLDMSKIESGKIELALEQISLSGLMQGIEDICRPLAAKKHQHLRIRMNQVCHDQVIADKNRLQQILMNLLSNAVKYTPEEGSITLEVKERSVFIPGRRQYEFVCTDNGTGISREFMPYIFEPFSRAEDPRISKLQGTGLGMTITENIVRMMNGTIEVESELEKGSKFTVTLSLEVYQKEQINDGDLKEAFTTGGGREERQPELSGKRVLLVEDNDINREIVMELLQMEQVETEAVENGKRALEVFEASVPGTYHAILMDVQMPVMNGYEAAAAIRNLKRQDAQKIPIIALTADAFAADVAKARSAGMNDHIAKPIEVKHLFAVLQKWMV